MFNILLINNMTPLVPNYVLYCNLERLAMLGSISVLETLSWPGQQGSMDFPAELRSPLHPPLVPQNLLEPIVTHARLPRFH